MKEERIYYNFKTVVSVTETKYLCYYLWHHLFMTLYFNFLNGLNHEFISSFWDSKFESKAKSKQNMSFIILG